MPRARNIKHGFFTNDQLADNDPLGRLLFIGMWTLADYKGDLEWNARRIKVQLLPYDDCDIQQLAINLDKSGFVRFYSDGEKVYARVVNFERHQNPHKNEKANGSKVPAYTDEMRQVIDLKGLTINRDKSGSVPCHSHTDPADSCSLIPDPGTLNPEVNTYPTPATPDAVFYIPTNKHSTEGETFPVTQAMIDKWRQIYPAVDIETELRKNIGWADANPSKRKTLGGMPRHLNTWLSGAQDRGGGGRQQQANTQSNDILGGTTW